MKKDRSEYFRKYKELHVEKMRERNRLFMRKKRGSKILVSSFERNITHFPELKEERNDKEIEAILNSMERKRRMFY